MTAPKTRATAIAAKCKDCIHDPAAAGTWREQATVCTSITCALWNFRPLSANAPAWLTSRDAADLPQGWTALDQADAVRVLREGIDDKANGCAVHANGGTRTGEAIPPQGVAVAIPETHGFGGSP